MVMTFDEWWEEYKGAMGHMDRKLIELAFKSGARVATEQMTQRIGEIVDTLFIGEEDDSNGCEF